MRCVNPKPKNQNKKMKYEVLTEDSFFHIYNCGNNKENIFIENENYDYFLRLIKIHISEVSEVLAYCLLKNHFHLVIKTDENIESKKISQSFSNFFNAYSKSINKKYERTGSLFQDRFKRVKIDNDEYIKNCITYIHLNPIHHGFVDDFRDYKHSSYKSYFSEKNTSLYREYVINLFGGLSNFKFYHEQKQLQIIDYLTLE